MNCQKVSEHIINWLSQKIESTGLKGFVVGVSGGIDSAVVSTLCARTGRPTLCMTMPIHQAQDQISRANMHMKWLKLTTTTGSLDVARIDLTDPFESLSKALPDVFKTELSLANTRARLRMTTLYAAAGTLNRLVAGTGNRIEDFGLGFFTKHGDGAIDISPIGDLLKTQVWELGTYLGVSEDIIKAKPTDGLWGDNRSDEDQIGASYQELEWALGVCGPVIQTVQDLENALTFQKREDPGLNRLPIFSSRQMEVLGIYLTRHQQSAHKMAMPPVCEIPKELLCSN